MKQYRVEVYYESETIGFEAPDDATEAQVWALANEAVEALDYAASVEDLRNLRIVDEDDNEEPAFKESV